MDNKNLWDLSKVDMLPSDHTNYLFKLKEQYHFSPKTIYDIGSCALHWSKPARTVWPEANFYLFEAMEQVGEIYETNSFFNYNLGVLGDTDGKEIKFYQNNDFPGGNSYYKENSQYCGAADSYFDDNHTFNRITSKLDTVVKSKGFTFPDLIKIDVQGCEVDILKGAAECLKTVKHLIVELQHVEYNKGAWQIDKSIPFIESLGFKLESSLFSRMEYDGDYHFIKL